MWILISDPIKVITTYLPWVKTVEVQVPLPLAEVIMKSYEITKDLSYEK